MPDSSKSLSDKVGAVQFLFGYFKLLFEALVLFHHGYELWIVLLSTDKLALIGFVVPVR